MTPILYTFALVSIASIIAVVYSLREVVRSNRELTHKLMARDLTEYARAKPVLDKEPDRPKAEPREKKVQPFIEQLPEPDVIGAQAAFDSLTGGL